MEDGLFTIIFIALFIVMSVLDAVGRRRKRQRQMEDLDQDEVGGEVEGAGAADSQAPWEVGNQAPTGAEGERETADQMVPEDFWAILTGQAPSEPSGPTESQHSDEPEALPRAQPVGMAGSGSEGGSSGGREGSRHADYRAPGESDALGRRSDPKPQMEAYTPFPLPGDRVATPTPQPAPPSGMPPTRRSARWMEGVGGRSDRDTAFEPGRGGEFDPDDPMGEPWDDLADISEGDLTSGDQELEVASVGEESRRPSAHRRGRGRGDYTRLLETGNREDLRKAIVLREVLGPPVGSRD